MKKIMFICLGNICRSPMAELILKHLLSNAGLAEEFTVASAATSDDEMMNGVGSRVYPPIKAVLERNGISSGDKRVQILRAEDYDKYDVFYCMDKNNVVDAKRILCGDPENKVKKFFSIIGEDDRDVEDPWFTRNFEKAFNDVYTGCEALLEILKNN